jgi:hypothetical protein
MRQGCQLILSIPLDTRARGDAVGFCRAGDAVSGFHHNVLGGFLSLKFSVWCAGVGEVRLRDFIYLALQE